MSATRHPRVTPSALFPQQAPVTCDFRILTCQVDTFMILSGEDFCEGWLTEQNRLFT